MLLNSWDVDVDVVTILADDGDFRLPLCGFVLLLPLWLLCILLPLRPLPLLLALPLLFFFLFLLLLLLLLLFLLLLFVFLCFFPRLRLLPGFLVLHLFLSTALPLQVGLGLVDGVAAGVDCTSVLIIIHQEWQSRV